MYTELLVKGTIRADAPPSVLSALQRLIHGTVEGAWPAHRFFRNPRRDEIALGRSAYFVTGESAWDSERREFFINSSLKDYDATIREFLDWLLPYCAAQPGEFLGYRYYEEVDMPALIQMP